MPRPANALRTFFHVLSGVGTVLLLEVVLSEQGMLIVAALVAAWAWSMEIGRRFSPRMNEVLMWIFGKMAHPHEYRQVNSSTWYITALLFLALTGSKMAAALGVIVLAVGDPAAGIVGRSIGRTKLVNRRSLEGTLAFVLFAAPAAFAVMAIFHPEVPAGQALIIALSATVIGAVAELFAARVDDNLLVPLASGCAALALALPLGVAFL